MELVASSLSAAATAKLREAFVRIDADNSGVITYSEMAHAMKDVPELGSSSDIASLMRSLDTDGDGKISWHEFLIATAQQKLIQHQSTIWAAFCDMDLDGE